MTPDKLTIRRKGLVFVAYLLTSVEIGLDILMVGKAVTYLEVLVTKEHKYAQERSEISVASQACTTIICIMDAVLLTIFQEIESANRRSPL